MNLPTTFWGLDSLQWTAVSAVATATYCVAFIFSLIFIGRQVSHMRTSTTATALLKAMDILQDEKKRDDRRLVFALTDLPFEQWTEDQKRIGERVIHSYDQVGLMVRAGMFRKKLIVDGWGNSLRRAKPLLMPLVREYREKWNSKEIWDDFEWLCEEAEKFNRGKRWWEFWK